MNNETLRECPFCGSDVELTFIGNDYTKKRSVEVTHKTKKGCPVKFKQSALRNGIEWLADAVAEAWNTRANIDRRKHTMTNEELAELPWPLRRQAD